MNQCRLSLVLLLSSLVFSTPAGWAQEKGQELFTLPQALAKIKDQIKFQQNDFQDQAGMCLQAVKAGASEEKTREMFSGTMRAVQLTTEMEITRDRLLLVDYLQASKKTEKKLLTGWIEQSKKVTIPLGTPAPSPALGVDFEAVDNLAKNLPPEATRNLLTLASHLKKPKKAIEKARAIYTWITINIAYDRDNAFTVDARPEIVLQSRRANCGGFANLFEALGKLAGLEVHTIRGNSRFLDHEAQFVDKSFFAPNGVMYGRHGWNAVKIDGKYWLVDVTFGDRQTIIKNKARETENGNDYFLVAPEALIYSHFPEDNRWQLLKNPPARTSLDWLPWLRPSFFRYGVQLESHGSMLIVCNGSFLVTLEAPVHVSLEATLDGPAGTRFHQAILENRQGKKVEFRGVLPRGGVYLLNLFARDKKEGKSTHIMKYRLVSNKGLGEKARMPQTFKSFLDHQVCLHHPCQEILPRGKQLFALTVPGARRVALSAGEKLIPLEKQGDMFMGEAALNTAEVGLVASFENDKEYTFLLKFQVE